MLTREWDDELYGVAEGQLGYFTAVQASDAGVLQVRLVQLHESGDIERVSRGVYGLERELLGAGPRRAYGAERAGKRTRRSTACARR